MKNIPLLLITLGGTIALIFGVSFLFAKQSAPVTLTTAETTDGARHTFTGEESVEATPSAIVEETATPSAESTESATTTETGTKVTVVEFSDFQCPACKAAYPLKEQLFANFPGKIEFMYRHYPLTSIHPNSLLAAKAAESAGQQGKFWEMHDILFERQADWESLLNDDAQAKFTEYAKELKLDEQVFSDDIKSDTVKSLVQQDIDAGDRLKVNATPTFFVNGKKVSAPDLISTVQSQLSQ